jgi:hypothetical protein
MLPPNAIKMNTTVGAGDLAICSGTGLWMGTDGPLWVPDSTLRLLSHMVE